MSKKMRAYILNFLAITAIFLVINLVGIYWKEVLQLNSI